MANSGANDKTLIHLDSMIGSMTPKEREKPALINAKRKIRIAKGSGTTVQEVNRLLKMHQEMETAMKKIRKMGGLKGLAKMFTGGGLDGRSEEHTSELQSLMRSSYAVYCLKKKNKQVTDESHAEAAL